MNKTIITGHLGRDPECRYTPEGQAVTSFSVAVSVVKKGGKKTMWMRVTTFDKTAENCNQYLKKGSKVLVEGSLNFDEATGASRIWKDKNTSEARTSFEMTAFTVEFLSPKDSADGMVEAAQELGGQLPTEEEIPF